MLNTDSAIYTALFLFWFLSCVFSNHVLNIFQKSRLTLLRAGGNIVKHTDAALPQLDRGPDYESGRHRFESCTPHQL